MERNLMNAAHHFQQMTDRRPYRIISLHGPPAPGLLRRPVAIRNARHQLDIPTEPPTNRDVTRNQLGSAS